MIVGNMLYQVILLGHRMDTYLMNNYLFVKMVGHYHGIMKQKE